MDRLTQDEGNGADARQGCPFHDVRQKLRRVGLRPTRQRVSLGWLLFAKGDRHVSAEILYEEAMKARVPVSLATVYNTLHQFTEAGLLRGSPSTAPRPSSTPTTATITISSSTARTR